MVELQPSKRATYAESLGNFVMLLVAFRHGCLAACYRFRRYTGRPALDLLFLDPLQNRTCRGAGPLQVLKTQDSQATPAESLGFTTAAQLMLEAESKSPGARWNSGRKP
jgi:hypothetical protein